VNYETACSTEAEGGIFNYGVRVSVAAPRGVTDGIKKLCRQFERELEEQITRDFYATDTRAHERASIDKRAFLALFSAPIYVEEVPNGYCSRACCEHLPWFVVTTEIGRIKIGWRKRVIEIDWTETAAGKAANLFPDEQVTKGDKMIHAWGYEDAAKYLQQIIASGAGSR